MFSKYSLYILISTVVIVLSLAWLGRSFILTKHNQKSPIAQTEYTQTETVSPTVQPITKFPSPTPTFTPTPILDLCESEKYAVITLLNKFEQAQMNRNPGVVLDLFTPPTNSNDLSTYYHLAGTDAAGARLYSAGQTNFNQTSFDIIEQPRKIGSNICISKVNEMRSYYQNGMGGFGPIQTFPVYFITIQNNTLWKIENYSASGDEITKYSGWGY